MPNTTFCIFVICSGYMQFILSTSIVIRNSTILIKCDWLAGIMCTYENKRHAILCVYVPCMSSQSANDDLFLECLGFLSSTIEELDCTCITIIGDWNADVSNDNHQFGNYLNQFCSDIGLITSSELKLPENSFTYKSDSWRTTSWIYHCVSSKDGHDIILDMEILYSESTGDHVPFRVGVERRPPIPTPDESSSRGTCLRRTPLKPTSHIQRYTTGMAE